MPSDKKRINLTVPDAIYEQLQVYKEENGLTSDATACLQLIVQQLKAQETNRIMFKLLRENSLEQIRQLSDEGLAYVKDALDKKSAE